MSQGGRPAIFRQRAETFGGFNILTRDDLALEVSDNVRRERCGRPAGSASGPGTSQTSCATWPPTAPSTTSGGRRCWSGSTTRPSPPSPLPSIRRIRSEPRVHPWNRNYEAVNHENVTLADLQQTPIDRITSYCMRTTASDYELDVLVMATGFDAVTD